jgi:predicted nucleic acid-binding protein
MAESFLLDTSAFITLTDKEAGAERVRELLRAGYRGDVILRACFVTLTETHYILIHDRGAERARRILSAIKKFPITWLHSDEALCAAAAELKANHKLSFADAFVAATAQLLNATLVHKDPEFAALAGIIKLEPLPPKGKN